MKYIDFYSKEKWKELHPLAEKLKIIVEVKNLIAYLKQEVETKVKWDTEKDKMFFDEGVALAEKWGVYDIVDTLSMLYSVLGGIPGKMLNGFPGEPG